MTPEPKPSARDTFLRTVAVVGLIAVLLLGAWGIIALAVNLPTLLGGIGNNISGLFTTHVLKENVAVTAPATSASGAPVSISWAHQNKGTATYGYSLSFACQSGLSVKAPVPNGTYQTVPCNTPFNYVNAGEKMTIVPSVSGNGSSALTVTVAANRLDTGVISTSGTATTQVSVGGSTGPAQNIPVVTTPRPTTNTNSSGQTYIAAPTRATLYGLGDLAVQINSVQPSYGRTTVVFTIENDGTNKVPAGWSFSAVLPINGSYTYNSVTQRSLNPGDKIVYTLGFDGGSQNYGNTYNYNNGYSMGSAGYYGPDSFGGQTYYQGASSISGASNYTCNSYGPCINNGQTQYPTYNYNQNYPYNYGQQGQIVITADPYNQVQELNKSNNSASAY